jgi:hypothetical protein
MRSFRLLFHLLPNECLDLVERNKRHAALFAVVSDMNQLPISALFALVIKTAPFLAGCAGCPCFGSLK